MKIDVFSYVIGLFEILIRKNLEIEVSYWYNGWIWVCKSCYFEIECFWCFRFRVVEII